MQQHRRHARSEVIDTAIHLLDEFGLADLTMRRLARELGLTPGALYWHFADKQELLGAVADRVLTPALAEADGAWRTRIVTVAGRMRDALLSHTDGAELVSASLAAGRSRAATTLLDTLRHAASDAGVGDEHAELTARTVVYYLLGFTADEQSRLQWDAAGATLAEGQSVLESNPNARFAFGLHLLMDGIAAHQSQRR